MKPSLDLISSGLNNMPGSVINCKAEIKDWILKRTDIFNIVDVGAGSGTYFELLAYNKIYKWTAVEIFQPYVKKFNLSGKYNKVIVGDISKINLPDGDLIIFGDVLEHLEKEEALRVLNKALGKYKHVVVSIPIDGRSSKIHFGNEYEAHLSKWTYEEFCVITDWNLTLSSKGIGGFAK